MKVLFLPQNKEVLAREGESLLDVCKRANISLGETCNGRGTCKKCKVILDWEEQLACQVRVEEDIEVIIPYEESEISDKKAKISQIEHEKIKKHSEKTKIRYGVAFDIGTTTVVGSLVDLENKEVLSIQAGQNPQRIAGADVISRIQYIEESRGNLCFLQNLILDCCEKMITKFGEERRIERIEKVTVVGNPTMSHIFLGYSPSSLARYPFSQQFHGIEKRFGENFKDAILASDLFRGDTQKKKLGMEVTVLPNIGGQIGSDITMGLLATNILDKKGNYIFIDIGTNAEMAFIQDGKCSVCSAAAGPVFEGASIAYGMRALDGAIESVTIAKNGEISVRTIGNRTAIGICGSGIIEIIAELLEVGIIRRDGYMLSRAEAKAAGIDGMLCERIYEDKEKKAFCLVDESIFITQEDVREIQLAKGAIKAGMQTLLKEVSKTIEDIDEILVGGAFGSYLDKKAARTIGLFPYISIEKIKMIGNTASIGAVQALLSDKIREKALELSKKATFVELASHSEFYENFLTSLNF